MFFVRVWCVECGRMSLKLACEAVAVISVVFFATAFAVTWKDCGEFTESSTDGTGPPSVRSTLPKIRCSGYGYG